MNTLVLAKTTRIFIALSLSCVFAGAKAQPAISQQTQKVPIASNVPREVRARMTANGRSLRLVRLPQKKGRPLLMHAWVEDKPASPSSVGSEHDKLRFHVDFFHRKNSKWQLSLPISYLSNRPNPPFDAESWGSYEWHWLDSRRKEGIVVVGKINLGIDGSVRLITLPRGVPVSTPATAASYQIQEFGESYAGGGGTIRIEFVVEADGKMVVVKDDLNTVGREKTIYGWRNREWQEVRKYSNRYKILQEMRSQHASRKRTSNSHPK